MPQPAAVGLRNLAPVKVHSTSSVSRRRAGTCAIVNSDIHVFVTERRPASKGEDAPNLDYQSELTSGGFLVKQGGWGAPFRTLPPRKISTGTLSPLRTPVRWDLETRLKIQHYRRRPHNTPPHKGQPAFHAIVSFAVNAGAEHPSRTYSTVDEPLLFLLAFLPSQGRERDYRPSKSA